jgi:hypothetical protein
MTAAVLLRRCLLLLLPCAEHQRAAADVEQEKCNNMNVLERRVEDGSAKKLPGKQRREYLLEEDGDNARRWL